MVEAEKEIVGVLKQTESPIIIYWDKLPRKAREFMFLYYLSEYKQKEIAKMYGFTNGNIVYHLKKGINALRGLMGVKKQRMN